MRTSVPATKAQEHAKNELEISDVDIKETVTGLLGSRDLKLDTSST
jgi:hypothetical protein